MIGLWFSLGIIAILGFVANEWCRIRSGIHSNVRLITFYVVHILCVAAMMVAVIAIATQLL
jgi:hypothetical protein